MERTGVSKGGLVEQVTAALGDIPKVVGAEVYLGESIRKLIDFAHKQADQMKDEYISVEHLLLAMSAHKASLWKTTE